MEYFSSLILNPLCSAWIQPRMWQCLFGWHSMLLIHYQQFVNKILGNVTDFFKFILLKGVVSSHDVFVSFLIRKEKLFRSIHGMHENRGFFLNLPRIYIWVEVGQVFETFVEEELRERTLPIWSGGSSKSAGMERLRITCYTRWQNSYTVYYNTMILSYFWFLFSKFRIGKCWQ